MATSRRLLFIGILTFLAFGLIYPFAPIDPAPKAGLCILVVIAGLWITEALPISITALMIPVLAALLNVSTLAKSLTSFASPVVFLIFGGFVLAAALHKHGLDQWFASLVLRRCGSHTGKVLVSFFCVTAFLSMWMSNASTALMMLPILFSILQRLPKDNIENTQTFALLGLAYASSLGGVVSLVGSPSNIIIAGQLKIDFFEWATLLGPAFLLFFPIMIAFMAWKLKPTLNQYIDVELVSPELNNKQRIVLLIFSLTAIAWMSSRPLATLLGIPDNMDTWIVLVSSASLVMMNLLEWDDIETHTQWGVLLLSGGGMCLSAVLQHSGAGEWLAHHVIDRAVGGDITLFVLVSIVFLILLTEMMSNAAAAALTMPILIITATSLDFPTLMLAPLVGLTSSMAFMFPISTPPNAIAFATGKVPLKTMISTGWGLNIIGVIFVFGYIMLLA